MISVNGEPNVIEYNARLGDPESEVIIPRIKSDLFDLIEGVAKGDLAKREIEIDERYAATVMAVSGGYPGEYEKGKLVSGIEKVRRSVVFHAGTQFSGDEIVTAGGRVLAVTSWGKSVKEALGISYSNLSLIKFEGISFRRDIGYEL